VDVVEQLGKLLREAGFGRDRDDVLSHIPGGLPPAEALATLDRPDDARLAILLRLFRTGETVPRPQADNSISPLAIDDLVEAGILETEGTGVIARASLAAFDDLIVAGDPARRYYDPDFVVNVSAATKTVANVTVRPQIGTALDLGTGSGIQALLAARHADQVIGVDINAHALALARLSQRLNAVDNIAWVEAEWFDSVRGQRFDLVVANPPVVISPDNTLLYRDSPVGGEELSRQLIRESAEHLTEGGFASLLCHWTHREGAWEEIPGQWVAALGCDALLLHFGSQEPLAYAMSMVADSPNPDSVTVAETVNRWIDAYNRAGVERIAVGATILRRRSAGPNWSRAFEVPGGPSGPGGDQLERMFAGGDFLAARSGADQLRELLSSAWRLLDGHKLDQTLVHENGAFASGPSLLRQEPGLGLHAQVDPRVAPVLLGCNGERPLAELIDVLPIPDGLDQAGFHSLCLETIRDLIAKGFLVGDALQSN
jgi:SAM-dependent methyltransferase